MNLRALQYFIALAELRHFRKAAERCHVSQPTLSTQIRKLEQQLGADLIERNSRQVLLTTLGERVLEHAKRAISETQAIRQLARDADDPFAGTLSLGIFPTLAPYLLPHVIPQIRKQHPKLTLRLFEEKTERVMSMLLDGQLDAILLALPLDSEQLHVEPLFNEPFVLVAPAKHRLSQRPAIDLGDLQKEPVLLLEDGHCLRQHALDVCQLAGALENLDFQASSLETLRHMVAAGSGVTLLPILATQPPLTTMDGLVARPFKTPAPQRTIAMAWRKSSLREELLVSIATVFKSLNPKLLQLQHAPS
ncbi:MAG: LysR substrate-binding domain-containing protein [Wenzhouxiangella sp.]|nr:LysR substrate-binding domain-containing protein [Wenzhouxiangella sp.]MDR9453007.1 LysR substrate-binding domain-containing protein [Wenzhouxiangella sp.]